MITDKLQIVVFGALDIAIEVMVHLPTHCQIVALVDNDHAKQGRLVMGLPVLAADGLVDVSCDAILSLWYPDIIRQ
jgi:FlaA1/EpsC-like NDP-sugar epimerase